jgi:hypothetical protein
VIAVLAVGIIAMTACLAIQAGALVLAARHVERAAQPRHSARPGWVMFLQFAILLVVLMLGNVVQFAIWALLYRAFGAIDDIETALYFSGVTFTTLGYGDVLLTGRIRLLAPLEAANGVMMFGITTATFISVVQRAITRRMAENAVAPAGGSPVMSARGGHRAIP